jgi:hypothetical protein
MTAIEDRSFFSRQIVFVLEEDNDLRAISPQLRAARISGFRL